MKAINEMTTAEMVAEYNALTGKDIKKFSSRAAGEKQLAKVRSEVSSTSQAAADVAVEKVEEKTGFRYDVDGCPGCGATEDQTAAGLDGTIAGDQRNFCHHCSTEYWRDTGKIYKAPAKSVNRSKSISESWNKPEVAAKRARRDNVKVSGAGVFRSVLEAFKSLNLPQSKHIKFRMALKQVGSGVFEYGGKTYEFTIVEKQ